MAWDAALGCNHGWFGGAAFGWNHEWFGALRLAATIRNYEATIKNYLISFGSDIYLLPHRLCGRGILVYEEKDG